MTPDLLSVIDASGPFEAVNPSWELLLGRTGAELTGSDAFALIRPHDVADPRSALIVLGRDEPLAGYEKRQRDRDGHYLWLSWTVVPEDGRYDRIARDVTRDKARQTELEQTQDTLRQLQKLKALGQLSGGVAHDFNDLLTPSIGGRNPLQRHGVGTPRRQRLIGGAMQSAKRARRDAPRRYAHRRRRIRTGARRPPFGSARRGSGPAVGVR